MKKILRNEFFKNSLTLFSGVSIAQIILLAITPILSRLYSKELFGLFFLFSSIIVIVKIINTFRLELAIMLPQRDKDAINLLVLGLIVNLLISIILLIIILVFQKTINVFLGEKNLGKYLYLIPLATFFVGISELSTSWNNRKKLYKNISYSKISKAIAQGSWNLGFGFAKLSSLGLIPGYIFGFIVLSSALIYKSFKEIVKLLKFLSIKRMMFLLKKYKNIPLYNTPINFIINMSNEIPILLMSGFFGASIVGLYGMANRIIASPADLVSRSVGQVFFQKASEEYNSDENLYILLKKTFWNLLKIGLVIFIPAFLISPFLKYILGVEWKLTGYFSMIIIPYIFVKLIFVPLSSVYTIYSKQLKMLYFFLGNFVLRILSIYIGFKIFNNALIAVGLFSFFGIIFYSYLISMFFKMTKEIEIVEEK